MPKISVIIPLYNVEKYIDKCINSVLNQSLKDIEIILVNDGSPDRCGQIAEEYKKIDRRVRVIHKENGGLSSARNAGLNTATGEFIAFVDSDDWIELNMLEELYNIAKKEGADLSVCNYTRIYEFNSHRDFLNIKDEVIDINSKGINEYFYKYYFNYIHGDEACNKIFKRSIIEEKHIRFERNSEVFAEDKLFNLYFIIHAKKIVSTRKSLYNYLQRDGSLMNSPKPNLMKQYVNLTEKFLVYARKNGKVKDIKYISPIILLDLIYGSIQNIIKAGATFQELKNAIIIASASPEYKKLMLKLFFGKATFIYCKKTNKKIKSLISIMIFGLLNFFGLYGLVSKIMFKKYKMD